MKALHVKTLDEWNGKLSSLQEVLPEARLVAAKKLTLQQMRNDENCASNAIVLKNMREVLFWLKLRDHEDYINHVLGLLAQAQHYIDDFDDFLSLLDIFPASGYQRWISETHNQWTQVFFKPLYLQTIDFFHALTHKPIAILRLIAQCKLESVLSAINNPQEQLFCIARLSWNDLPETWPAHSELHHYLIQLKNFIYFHKGLIFSKMVARSLPSLNEEWSNKEWAAFLVAFAQRTKEICNTYNIESSLSFSFITDSSILISTFQRLAKSIVATSPIDLKQDKISLLSYRRSLSNEANLCNEDTLESSKENISPEQLAHIIAAASPDKLIQKLNTLTSQWLTPLNESMFKIVLSSLDRHNPSHIEFGKHIYSLLLTTCEAQENVINILEPIKISSIWRFTSTTTFKHYIEEKREKGEADIFELVEMLAATQLFNQNYPNNTKDFTDTLRSLVTAGLHLHKTTSTGGQEEIGRRRKNIVAWLNAKIRTSAVTVSEHLSECIHDTCVTLHNTNNPIKV